MSFLDAFQEYHQITLALDDQEKTSFVTPIGNYHYKVMPFDSKNARSTYQMMMTKMFESQMGKNIKVYIEDMVVNPNQTKGINNLQPPRSPKEVQKLTRITAALNRFISRSADRCRPFFLLMNKWKDFEWTEECARAFQQLKEYLSHPPIMSSPRTDEVLFAYIVVAPHAVSLVLIRVDNGRQRLVYYVSKSLHEAEILYLPLEKAILAMVHGTRKLSHYFQAHTVVILTQLPLKAILRSANYT